MHVYKPAPEKKEIPNLLTTPRREMTLESNVTFLRYLDLKKQGKGWTGK
jgi:hypothetical protein